MRIKATTTGVQAAERYRGREKEGSREEATLQEEKKKNPHCAPAGFLSWYRQKQAAIFNTVQLCYLFPSRPTADQKRKKELVKGAACIGVCVPRSWPLGDTHTLSTMHTCELCELKSSVMSQTLSLWYLHLSYPEFKYSSATS